MAEETERRRRVTKQTVFDYITEIAGNVDILIEQRKKKSEKYTDLSSVSKDLEELQKKFRQAFPIKREKKEGTKSSGLHNPVTLKPALTEFLQLDEDSEPVTWVDVIAAFRTYLYRIKPLSERAARWAYLNEKKPYRDLRDPKQTKYYLLDAKLKKLLNYDQFVKDVKAGKIKVMRKSKEFVGKEEVTITDTKLDFNMITSLISKLIVKNEKPKTKAESAPEDEDEEEAPKKTAKKSAKAKASPKKSKVIEEDDDEEEEAPKKKVVPKAKAKAAPKKAGKISKKVVEDEEDDEGDEGEGEEETPKKKVVPKAKAKAAPKKAGKVSKKVIEDDEEEDDVEDDEGEEEDEEEEDDE